MNKGKNTCKILKDIRRKIAEANDIEYISSECKFKGDCTGTCPKCEQEVRNLEHQLQQRHSMGKKIAIAGIAASMAMTSGVFASQAQEVPASQKCTTEAKGKKGDVEIESVSPRVPSEPIRVTGVVVDANYQPIIGAQIMEDCKPLHGTATNINGEFQIAISGKNLLKCKAIGYLEQDIRIDPNTQFHPRLTVKLEDSPALMGGVIVIDTRWTHDDIYH